MRSRNIKPGLFKNELLGEYDPLATILFSGLWCLADKEGRLEDRPKRIKIEIFPYRDVDVSKLLDWLMDESFITRYQVKGEKYIQIMKWRKHQSPHHKEIESEIPSVDKADKKQADGQAQSKHEPSMNHDQTKESASSPLIPDSLNLIPDSEEEPETGVGSANQGKVPNCPIKKIVELYNSIANNLPKVRVTSQTMETHISDRWRSDPKHQSLKFWKYLFNYCENHKFLSGQTEGTGDRKPFRASLDWIVNPTNFAKINNNNYE